jgi:nucleotide-binding universal stress UspA family protein
MFRNILAPTDGSAASRGAVARAMQLAREQHARVTALWIGPPWEPNLYAYDGGVPPGFVSPRAHAAHVKSAAARHFAYVKKAAAAAGVRCTCVLRESAFPDVEIVRTARRNRCDLIVMASHSRRGFMRLLLGSVTAKVLAQTEVPVMVCR